MPGPTWSNAPRAYLRSPGEVRAFWQLGELWRLTASGHLMGNALSALDQVFTGDGGGPASHLHPSDEGSTPARPDRAGDRPGAGRAIVRRPGSPADRDGRSVSALTPLS